MYHSSITVPLLLTLFRLIIAPFLIPVILFSVFPLGTVTAHIVLGLFVVAVGLTDFFDGYLARKYNTESNWGKVLDPLADKFLLCSLLFCLIAIGRLSVYWALVVMAREFIVMGLREYSLMHGFVVPVARIGKIKTCVQLAALTYVVVNPYFELQSSPWYKGEQTILLFAAAVTLYSGYCYLQYFYEHVQNNISNQ